MTFSHVIFSSYGNDSIALLRWISEHRQRHDVTSVAVVYSDTGWAASGWLARVSAGEELARSYGFVPVRLASEGMDALVRRKRAFPTNGMHFCTEWLKIRPAQSWLNQVDPNGEAICCVGVRREESARRANWPEWVEESDKHGGRSLWSPLVRVTEADRDALISSTGFQVLPHRSRECSPCCDSGRNDLRLLSEEDVSKVETLEKDIGQPMFRAGKHQGESGIRQVLDWAHSEPRKHRRGQLTLFGGSRGCDGGWCGT